MRTTELLLLLLLLLFTSSSTQQCMRSCAGLCARPVPGTDTLPNAATSLNAPLAPPSHASGLRFGSIYEWCVAARGSAAVAAVARIGLRLG
jgi:hypothetical protein